MAASCRLLQTALIVMFLSPTLVRDVLGQTGIQNGGTVNVTCTAGSNADLQLTPVLPPGITPLFQRWTKLPDTGIAVRDDIVHISDDYQGRVELYGDASLRLKDVTPSDSGTYRLYMVSSDGLSQTLERSLQVLAMPTTETTPGAMTAPLTTSSVHVENDVYFLGVTEVIAGEAVQLNWTYSIRPGIVKLHEVWKGPGGNHIIRRIGNQVLCYDEYKGRVGLIGDNILLLNATRPADAGSYTTTAYFSDTSVHVAERQLIVHYAPDVQLIKFQVGYIFDNVTKLTVWVGETVRLRAIADCVPPATYTWSRPDRPLPDTAVVNVTTGFLTITRFIWEDRGNYTVVAENYLGNSSVAIVTMETWYGTPWPPNVNGFNSSLSPSEITMVAVGTTLGVTFLVCGGLGCCRCWWVKRRHRRAKMQNRRLSFHPFILDRVYPLEQPPPSVPARPQFMKYEVNRQDLELGEQIGRGAFGVVYLATLKRTAAGLATNRTVVVKTVHDCASGEEKSTFVHEIETTINLGEHRNLLGLVGCCTLTDPPYLVTEYLPYGDLKNFLLKCRQPQANSVYDMTDLKMYQIGRQIANGMVFISEAGFVHGDLAARNVLVGEGLLVKIADFGLATDVYERGYQRQDAEQRIPLRWMAPERLLREGRYTSKSDVWSFGVVLYEIATLGDVPYPSLGSILLEELRRGRREQRPQDCPGELYNMMLSCWQWDEFSRPEFQQLYLELDRLVETNADVSYLKLSSASSDDEKSSGIFTDSQTSSRQSLEAAGTSGTSEAPEVLEESKTEASQPSQDDPPQSGRSPTDRAKVGGDSYVYYKVPPKHSHMKERPGSGQVIGEEQIVANFDPTQTETTYL
ncbi:fibroblast growth factor receptor 2-like [Branchiostoma floridae]|uniref:Fibroblast growth factor receptor 2-like n=1 Tax=Branchiostoma floridae TaxID=7739 RepID=A0A9J7N5P8_BRAFL|nr:fibroblast growth factor receptor 2-like [Branchiostoma floridae]